MFFALVVQPDALECTYGDIPNAVAESGDACEVFKLEDGDWDLLDSEFVDAAYRVCHALLDYGDVDYLDAEQCALLQDWLDSRLENFLEPRLRILYAKLADYTRRAQILGTGVVIEL